MSLSESSTISIRVPATCANLGPGFDSLGLALKLYNHFEVIPADTDGMSIAEGNCVDVAGMSLAPEQNLFFKALNRFYEKLGQQRPTVHVAVEAHIPLARGLGSSSTAIVGGLLAGNILAGEPMSKTELIELATEIEGHADNVAPAVLGGVVLCDGPVAHTLPWPEDWQVAVVVPEEKLLTETARGVLPEKVPMADAVYNMQKAALWTHAVHQRDEAAFQSALADKLHQPYRGPLIPVFEPVAKVAATCGAFGAVVSGAGPSVAVFYPKNATEKLVPELKSLCDGLSAKVLAVSLDDTGAHLRG